jgi:rubrerythrin
MGFFSSLKKESQKSKGPQEYKIKGKPLVCPICGGTHFSTRKTLLTSSSSALMNLQWADQQSDNYICSECGYLFWFMPQD